MDRVPSYGELRFTSRNSRCVIFREHPFLEPKGQIDWLRKLLDNGDFGTALHLNSGKLLPGGMDRLLDLRIMRHFRLAAIDLLKFGGDLGSRLQQVLQFFSVTARDAHPWPASDKRM
ncbi:MAG TPA: hypothetical protein VNQ76_22650 [Planctomicrobium sp.]|nr:hypothetical protein [Planctomicrobium sp.]